jgi:hypothetical protein
MAARSAEFVPVTQEELATVRVSAAEARATAFASDGFHYALADGIEREAPWLSTGFVYLGRWSPPLESLGHAPRPDPTPVYLVQVLAPLAQFPQSNTAFVVVDALTGEVRVTFSSCVGPTCETQ